MIWKAIYKPLPAHTAGNEGRHLRIRPHISKATSASAQRPGKAPQEDEDFVGQRGEHGRGASTTRAFLCRGQSLTARA